ncbi:hypothetical protein [Naasia lichenicola]|uniref:Uncharacterized protein n=1 Tax=Naasia lichenicola TaxID=2565933 RepID=A0A4S4FRR3_9MICO|nr:hypothetical protein [Naasia lichenicola]THG33359.1 hypothetical protein E6C64_03130 [Naasia lichenicola]
MDIGEALRTAQESAPDRAKLRELSTARRQLVGAIADLGTTLAEEAGRSVSASVRDEVEQTLGAALADPSAADALRTGRLVRALSTDGLDAVDLDGAVAGGPGTRSPARGSSSGSSTRGGSRTSKGTASSDPEDLDARRRRKDAEKALAEAEENARAAAKAAEEAARAESAAEDLAEQAEQQRSDLADQVEDLKRRLTELRDRLDDATDEVDTATRDRLAAARRRVTADRDVASADAEVERLRERLERR